MKKLKSILCGALAFVAGSLVLSACGAKTEPNKTPEQQQEQQQSTVGTKTTISLAEAKRIIVNALAINNNQLQTQSTKGMRLYAASAEEGNRDTFEKLGKFDIYDYQYSTNPETDEKLSESLVIGKAIYHNGFQTCSMNFDDIVEKYWVNGEYFELYGSVRYDSNIKFNENFGSYQELFEEEAFDRVYDDTATKEINKDGYSITLTGDLKSFFIYSDIQHGYTIDEAEADWESYQEYIKDYSEYFDKCHFNVIVNIDGNNDVISASVDIAFFTISNGVINMTKELVVFTREPNLIITEPEWVTNYKLTDEYKNKTSNQ